MFFSILYFSVWSMTNIIYPQFLTTSYSRCSLYFNLDNVPYVLVDQLKNQGKDVFAFGESIYFFWGLDESQVNALSKDMIKKGAIETSDKIVLTKQRGEIVGEFKLFKGDSPAQIIVSYKELNSL